MSLTAIAMSSWTRNTCGVLTASLALGPCSRTFLISSRPFFGMMTPAESFGPLGIVRSTLLRRWTSVETMRALEPMRAPASFRDPAGRRRLHREPRGDCADDRGDDHDDDQHRGELRAAGAAAAASRATRRLRR